MGKTRWSLYFFLVVYNDGNWMHCYTFHIGSVSVCLLSAFEVSLWIIANTYKAVAALEFSFSAQKINKSNWLTLWAVYQNEVSQPQALLISHSVIIFFRFLLSIKIFFCASRSFEYGERLILFSQQLRSPI